MAKQEIKISLEVPEGYEATGEYRVPRLGDVWAASDGTVGRWSDVYPLTNGLTPRAMILKSTKRIPQVGEVWRSPLGTYLIESVWLSSTVADQRFLGRNLESGYTASGLNVGLEGIFEGSSHADAAFLAPDLETYFREKFAQESSAQDNDDSDDGPNIQCGCEDCIYTAKYTSGADDEEDLF